MNPGRKVGQINWQGSELHALAKPASPRPSTDTSVSKSGAPSRILVVEDQDDVRRMLATALEIEGYQVDEASNARDALSRLQQRHYHLILSDYAMPGGTGGWLLQEASRRGFMDHTVAMIVTAHPDVTDVLGVTVIAKPLDLDNFLDQVRKIITSSRLRNVRTFRRVPPAEEQACVELVLYISSESPASMQARKNLGDVLAEFDITRVKYSVVDLSKDPMAGEADRIAFTPTLVKRHPGPRTWIVGNLRNHEALIDLLLASGINVAR